MTLQPLYILDAILIGLGATLLIDMWALFLKRAFSVRSLDYCLLGRWVLYIPHGTIVHAQIAATPAKPHECKVGWTTHYLIGTAFALVFVLLASESWLAHPTLLPALAFGVAMELLDRMRSYHVPGVSIAVIDNDRVVFAKGYGVAAFGGSKAVDTTTLFLAGSISKPVFASGFLRLAEDRKISLDADINSLLKSWHLPESKFTEREKVTPRRLLTHSAGLTVWGFPGYALDSVVPSVPQLLDGTPPANTAAVRNDTFPGARWLYSGGGITILQLATTDITGEDFPTLMRRLVLQPAGMMRSTYENPLPMSRRGGAASRREQIDTPVPGGFHVYPEMAAAGLWKIGRWSGRERG